MKEKHEETFNALFHKPDDIGQQLTPEEELERLAWELNVAENNYWQAVAKYRDVTKPVNREKERIERLVRKNGKTLKAIVDSDYVRQIRSTPCGENGPGKVEWIDRNDSGVSEVDQSPGSELTDYTDKHGQ